MTATKRQFLATAAAGGLVLAARPAAAAAPARGPGLLTVTGAIGRGNRGPSDPKLDPMLDKFKTRFDKAHVFDFAAIAALKAVTIRPTLEDGKVHTLKGPLLADVLKAAGSPAADATKLALRAVDGYTSEMDLAQARARRFIVATHLDGAPMNLGGTGPLWAVFDADRIPEVAAKPLGERYAGCPWALFHIDVQAA